MAGRRGRVKTVAESFRLCSFCAMPVTIRTVCQAGQDLRAWCFLCARGQRVDPLCWVDFVSRGWPIELAAAARRFRCKECRQVDHVALFPATRPVRPPVKWEDEVVSFFHASRSAAKRGRPR